MRIWRMWATAFLALTAAGCAAPPVSTDVNRFPSTSLPATLEGKTFAFLPTDKQEGSVEYETHAAVIASYLEKQGWRRVSDLKTADYAVMFSYGQSGGRVETYQSPIYGQTGGGTTSYTSGTVNAYGSGGSGYGSYSGTTYTPPTYGVVGTATESRTVYTRFLDAEIYDWRRTVLENKRVGVWEGKATSNGVSSTFAVVSKCMIRAVFENFRKAGSENVRIPLEQCQ